MYFYVVMAPSYRYSLFVYCIGFTAVCTEFLEGHIVTEGHIVHADVMVIRIEGIEHQFAYLINYGTDIFCEDDTWYM